MQNAKPQSPASTILKPTRSRRILRWLLPLLVVCLLSILPLRVAFAGYQTYRTLRQVIARLRTVDHPAALGEAQPLVTKLGSDLAHLQATLTPLMPILDPLTFVPRYGPLLASLDTLIDAGIDGAAILDRGLGFIDAATFDPQGDSFSAWVALGPILAPLHDDLAALELELSTLPLSEIRGEAGEALAQVHATVELATIATQMGAEWPQLLGNTRPATYLIIVQNNHELRATGGFISSVAPFTLVQGRLQKVEFVDSYAIYSSDLAYPPAPAPMRDFMDIELLTLRDANWSPNLPSAATLIRTLYQQHTGLAVDGIITVDLDAVALLLPAFEHLTLPDSSVAITQENVEQALVQLWNDPTTSTDSTSPSGEGDWWAQRKDFIGQLTAAAFERLQQRAVNPLALAGGLVQALDRRAVQVWLFDTAAQPPLIERGWDGGLHPASGADYVALVDSNMGYNKADAVVTRQLDYRVAWPTDPALGAEATLTITYTHPLASVDPRCRAESYYGRRYEDMMARCYFDYSRVYVPAGSELISAEGWLGPTVTSQPAEQGTQQFAGYFVLNPATRHQVTLRYRLPATIHPTAYQLVVQRQAGTDPLPMTLQSESSTFAGILVNGQFTWSPRGAKAQP